MTDIKKILLPTDFSEGSETAVSYVLSLADKYDALRSPRHYKPAFTHEKTVSILRQDDRSGISGEQVFGDKIMQLFMDNHLKFNEIYESMKD